MRRVIKEQEGGNDVCRLYWLGVELSHGQALSFGRQIAESIDRERLARTQAPDPEEPVTDTVPVLKVVAEKLVVAASFDAGQIRTPSDLRFGSGAVGRTQ
jgi:hypothetical protein